MAYKIQWHKKTTEDLKRLTPETSRKIIRRVNTYLVNAPGRLGEPLTGSFKGLNRYRYGDYRDIYIIDEAAKVVSILRVRHRREVYESF